MVKIFRNESNDLHREDGSPALQMGHLKCYFVFGKLHRADGPAVIDRYSHQYWWKGIVIPEDLWFSCITMTPQEILAIPNAELRRAIIEKVGFKHFEKKAKVLSVTNKGTTKERTLLKLEIPKPDEDAVFVRVLDGTIKPNGERHTYYLRVPPNITDADEAVAWTWGMTKDEYQPVEET